VTTTNLYCSDVA